jgi:hypothetical protein
MVPASLSKKVLNTTPAHNPFSWFLSFTLIFPSHKDTAEFDFVAFAPLTKLVRGGQSAYLVFGRRIGQQTPLLSVDRHASQHPHENGCDAYQGDCADDPLHGLPQLFPF